MPFIGNQPALSYTSFVKQDFTTSATTSYTLDNPVTNENELALFINFVRQEPTTAYTASGTSLTLTSATSATDDMYCVYLGKAVQTVNPPAGSVGASQISDGSIALAKLSATGTKDATTFLRGDNTFAVAGGANTPAFSARRNSTFTLNHATSHTMTYTAEEYDTDGAFNPSTGIFTVPETGKYFFTASFMGDTSWNTSTWIDASLQNSNRTSDGIYSNIRNVGYNSRATGTMSWSATCNLNDQIKVLYYQESGSNKGIAVALFSGFKIIE